MAGRIERHGKIKNPRDYFSGFGGSRSIVCASIGELTIVSKVLLVGREPEPTAVFCGALVCFGAFMVGELPSIDMGWLRGQKRFSAVGVRARTLHGKSRR